jgi:5'-deoxy-5'-methylthioadenosine phosphorylase
VALIGLLGGSGLDHWGEPLKRFTAETPFGAPSGPLDLFEVHGHELLFLPRHGPEHEIAPHRINYRANLHALFEHGVSALLAVNAVGSMSQAMAPGALAVPRQLIDYTWGRSQSFRDGDSAPLAHVEFAEPFSARWCSKLLTEGQAKGLVVHDGGCLAVTQGPRLETAAEIRRLMRDGCDLVGMTTMPEATLARELDLPYATLAVVANFAAGLAEEPISEAAIAATLEDSMGAVRELIDGLLEKL